jgi:aminoacylase
MIIDFFQKYLCIDTTFPGALYHEAGKLFEQQAQNDGFEFNTVELPSGFPAFVITYKGSDESLPALALNHHMDVVPADPSGWDHHPFAGVCENGLIIGRGTQDMKGVGFVHYAAMRRMKLQNIQLKRTIHLLMVPDEERGGFGGVPLLLQTDFFKSLNIGFVLDEGCASGDEKKLHIHIAERKAMHVTFTAQGKMGHGSRLQSQNPNHDLVLFLEKLVSFQQDQRVLLNNYEAGLLLSTNVTSLTAGVHKDGAVAINAIPDVAQATVDIRVPPQMKMDEAYNFIQNILKPFSTIQMKIEAQSNDFYFKVDAHKSSEIYQVLVEAIQAQGLHAEAMVSEGSSDLRFYLAHGIQGFGLTPFTIKPNIHGVNEAVRVTDLELGCNIIFDVITRFCL